jgi:hypothetical protein
MSDFWTEGNIEELSEALGVAMDVLHLGAKGVVNLVRRHVGISDKNPIDPVEQRFIIRVRNRETKRPRDTNKLSMLLTALGKELLVMRSLNESDTRKLSNFFRLHKRFMDFKPLVYSSKTQIISEKSDISALTQNDDAKILDVFLAYFSLPRDSSSATAEYFLLADQHEAHFETYRFSAISGKIIKSFTVVMRAKNGLPMTLFSNFRELGPSMTKYSTGVCLSMQKEVVFFGHSDAGSAAKIFTFNAASKRSDLFTGMLSAHEPQEGSIAARFIMKRSRFKHHLDCSTGSFDMNLMKSQLNDSEIDLIRNKVKFKLERPIFDSKNSPISQKAMVSHIDRLLVGDNFIQDEMQEAFNPADDFHYTYNSALRFKD